MSLALTLDSAGRVVLPSETRKQLNLRPGSRLLLSVVAERIELVPEPETAAPAQRSPNGRLVLAASTGGVDAATAVRAERVAQARRREPR